MQQEILNCINELLGKKHKAPVALDDRLHSSGVLSSIEMFELILYLEQHGWKIARGDNLYLPMGEIDLVRGICESVQMYTKENSNSKNSSSDLQEDPRPKTNKKKTDGR